MLHGQEVTAEHIELAFGHSFIPREFASLCNALSWATAQYTCTSVPAFTERVNTRDEGIDAEWTTTLPEEGAYRSPLLGPGWNVFQYKQRGILPQGRGVPLRQLERDMRAAVCQLYAKTKSRPDRYVLFTNLHLTPAEKKKLISAILTDYDQPDTVHIEVVGAAELAAFINAAPHVRASFFSTSLFATWERARDQHHSRAAYPAKVELVGRDRELDLLRSYVEDDDIKAIVVLGPHGSGKSRLALQATEQRLSDVVVALDPESLNVRDVLSLASADRSILVLIEDPNPARIDHFLRLALENRGIKLMLTVPTLDAGQLPSYDFDPRVRQLPLPPLTDEEAHKLLQAARSRLDVSLEFWVVDQAGGNPGILLIATTRGMDLRPTAIPFVEQIAQSLEQKIRRWLGDESLEVLQLLSLLSHVGVAGNRTAELELVCSTFGTTIQSNVVLNTVSRLQTAGWLRRVGAYAEVLPPLLANHLTVSALRGRLHSLWELYEGLDVAGRVRLVLRLQGIKSDEVGRFWEELFASSGSPLTLASALDSGEFLPLLAATMPERTVQLIDQGLTLLDEAALRALPSGKRHALMRSLDDLLFHRGTSATALRAVATLALADPSGSLLSATNLFCECFHPLHPQLPLALKDRRMLLEAMVATDAPLERRVLGVKAIVAGTKQVGGVTLRRGDGPEPLDIRPMMTYGEIASYTQALVDLLMDLACSDTPHVADPACKALPTVVAEFTLCGLRTEAGIERFANLVDWAQVGLAPVSVGELVVAMQRVARVLLVHAEKANEPVRSSMLRACAERLQALIRGVDNGNFKTRLERWTGTLSLDYFDQVKEGGDRLSRPQRELRQLADEVVRAPANLTDDLFDYLLAANTYQVQVFFSSVGEQDADRTLLPHVERIGCQANGVGIFASYFGGLSKSDRPFANSRLDELTSAGPVTAAALLAATLAQGGDTAGVGRVEQLLTSNRIDVVQTARELSTGGWMHTLSVEDYLHLLRVIAGPGLANAMAVVDSLAMWVLGKRPLEGLLREMAWQCLEVAIPTYPDDDFACDQVAASLTPQDTQRAFALFDALLQQPDDRNCWDPLDDMGQNLFWTVLHEADPARALRTALSCALHSPSRRFRITMHLREILEQKEDKDILLAHATKSEEDAARLAECITAARPGFWPIALAIVQAYPTSEVIQRALTAGATWDGQVIVGSHADHTKRCLEDVQRALNDSSTPPAGHSWLTPLRDHLRKQLESDCDAEVEEYVHGLR